MKVFGIVAVVCALLVASFPTLTTAHASGPPQGVWDTGVAPVPVVGNYWSATVAPNSDGSKQLIYMPGFYLMAYDPGADSWACATNVPSTGCASRTLSPMPDPRWGGGEVTAPDSSGRKRLIYVAGGYNANKSQTELDAYDPSTNTWTTLAPMPTRRDQVTAAVGADSTGTKQLIYVIGGTTDGGPAMTTVEAYDPSTNTWLCSTGDTAAGCASTSLSPLPFAVSAAAAVAVNSVIYTIGSQAGVLAYSTSQNTWTSKAAMPNDSWFLAAAAGSDGRIYALGGSQNLQVEAYDPATDSWDTSIPTMPNGGGSLAAAAGPDGRIYVMGGYRTTFENYMEAYTPVGANPPSAATLTTTSGPVGTSTTFSASGFDVGEKVDVYWDNSKQAALMHTTATNAGNISAGLTVPVSAQFGHTILAIGESSGHTAATNFQVVQKALFTKRAAPAYSFTSIALTGFQPYEQLPIKINGTVVAYGSASRQGAANVPFTVPGGLTRAAAYPATVCGVYSILCITSSNSLIGTQGVQEYPPFGQRNRPVRLRGGSFPANQAVSVKWNCASPACPAGKPLATKPTPLKTGLNGTFVGIITIPANAPISPKPVPILVTAGGVSVVVNYTVSAVPPAINGTMFFGPGYTAVGGPPNSNFSAATAVDTFDAQKNPHPVADKAHLSSAPPACIGYRARFGGPTVVSIQGRSQPGDMVTCTLRAGYNLIGNPFLGPAALPAGMTASYLNGGTSSTVSVIPVGGAVGFYNVKNLKNLVLTAAFPP